MMKCRQDCNDGGQPDNNVLNPKAILLRNQEQTPDSYNHQDGGEHN